MYGNCFTFNSGFDSNGSRIDLKKSTIAGQVFGLRLTLYVNFYEEFFLLEDQEFANGFGALFRIGNSTYQNNDILVSFGFQTNIAVEREFKTILPKPYSNCEFDSDSSKFRHDVSDLYNLIIQSEYAYTQQFCFLQCFQKHVFNKFNCSIIHFPSLYKFSSECKLNDSTDIFSESFYSFCLPLCPLECNKDSFKTSVSSYTIFALKYINYIKSNRNLATDFTRSEIDSATTGTSFCKVNIFYESLSYVLTTESPKMDIISLLASIGGNLGLFLGVSVFSLCETIEVIIEMVFILKRRKE